MNRFIAKVIRIDSMKGLNLVNCDFQGDTLEMLSLELNDDIKIGSTLALTIKSTNIILSKSRPTTISSSNILQCSISEVTVGKLLSTISLTTHDTPMESIVTSKFVAQHDIKKGDRYYALFNASALFVSEIDNG